MKVYMLLSRVLLIQPDRFRQPWGEPLRPSAGEKPPKGLQPANSLQPQGLWDPYSIQGDARTGFPGQLQSMTDRDRKQRGGVCVELD